MLDLGQGAGQLQAGRPPSLHKSDAGAQGKDNVGLALGHSSCCWCPSVPPTPGVCCSAVAVHVQGRS